MKRTLIKLCVFVLAGAILNVAVAWGCVLRTDTQPSVTFAIPTPQGVQRLIDQGTWLRIDRRGSLGCVEQDGGYDFTPAKVNPQAGTVTYRVPMFCDVGGPVPDQLLPIASASWTRLGDVVYRGKCRYIASEVAAGWPAMSFWGAVAS